MVLLTPSRSSDASPPSRAHSPGIVTTLPKQRRSGQETTSCLGFRAVPALMPQWSDKDHAGTVNTCRACGFRPPRARSRERAHALAHAHPPACARAPTRLHTRVGRLSPAGPPTADTGCVRQLCASAWPCEPPAARPRRCAPAIAAPARAAQRAAQVPAREGK